MDNTEAFLSVVDILKHRAAKQPDKKVYTFLKDGETEDVSLTFQMLDLQARSIAAVLQQKCRPGDRVIMIYPPGIDFIPAFFGCLYAGVMAVPVYPPNPAKLDISMKKFMAIYQDSSPSALLTTQDIGELLHAIGNDYPVFNKLPCISSNTIDLNMSGDFKPPSVGLETIAFLQYTSGSTGTPKGVMVSHGNILHNEEMIKIAFNNTEQCVWVGWLPFFHDMGLIGNVLQMLYLGSSCYMMSPVDFIKKPVRWLQAMSRYQATSSGGPNFGYELCTHKVSDEDMQHLDLSHWKMAYNGAEPIRADTLKQFSDRFKVCGFREAAFYPCYGMAEATLFISGGLRKAKPVYYNMNRSALEQDEIVPVKRKSNRAQTIVGCGRAWHGQKICVVDPVLQTLCAETKVGEIWVKSDSVTMGYWNKPEETRNTFKAYLKDTGEGPFLRTGDLGFMVDKEVFITGRQKDMIIIHGRNLYPHDIEKSVSSCHPSVRPGCCAAFSVEIDNNEKLVVVQEIKDSDLGTLDWDAVIESVYRDVSKHHDVTPYAIVLIKQSTLPKTSSGKVQRRQCRNDFLENSLDIIAKRIYQPLVPNIAEKNKTQSFESRESIEDWLALKVSRYASVDSDLIELSSSVLDYGLDSKQIMSLSGEVEEIFGRKVSATIFINSPTISDIAEHLMERILTKKN